MKGMNSKHSFLAVWITCFLVLGLCVYGLTFKPNDGSVTVGVLTWCFSDASGMHISIHHNIKTLIADQYERNAFGFGNATNVTPDNIVNVTDWMSLGNCTPANTLTKITTEASTGNLSRQQSYSTVSWMNGTHRAVNFTCEWTGTLNYVSVSAIGLHWNPTGDLNLYAVAYCTDGTYQQFGVGSKATAIWTITYL